MTRIVVGVDGSSHSKRALRRAVEEAALRGATVDAVYVFPPPPRRLSDDLIGLPFGIGGSAGSISPREVAHHPPSEMQDAVARAERQLEIIIGETTEGTDLPAPRAVVVANSHPAEALVNESRSADLLVIGTRGRGEFAGMLLGSVAHHCIQHARCPMLILPPED